MDAIDKRILNILQSKAKQNTKEIAQQIGLTVSPTFERIKKLEQQNIIAAYVAILAPAKVGKNLIAFCHISLFKHSKDLLENFKKEIALIPEIMECHHVSGIYDFLLKVAVDSMEAYHQFAIEKLSIIDGISNIQSSFIMESVKDSTAYYLE